MNECEAESLKLSGTIVGLNGYNEQLNTQINDMRDQIETCTLTNEDMMKQIPELHMKSIDLINEITDLKTKLTELEAELEVCSRDNLQELLANIERLKRENQNLQDEIEIIQVSVPQDMGNVTLKATPVNLDMNA